MPPLTDPGTYAALTQSQKDSLYGGTGVPQPPKPSPQSVATQPPPAVAPIANPVSNQSTTTLSSDQSDEIARIKAQLEQLTKNNGVTTTVDQKGTPISTYANNTPYTPGAKNDPMDAPGGISPGGYVGETYYAPGEELPVDAAGKPFQVTQYSPTDVQEQNRWNDLKARSDKLTADRIDQVTQEYDRLIRQQQNINKAQEGSRRTGLLSSNSLQMTASGNDALTSTINYGQQQIADLISKKNAAILTAQEAALDKDYQLADKMSKVAQDAAKRAREQTDKIREAIAKQNEKLAEQQLKVAKDQSIIDVYSSGTTDAAGILKKLKEQGDKTVTLKDVTDALKELVPKGLDDLVDTLRKNVAPADLVKEVLASNDMDEAYRIAASRDNGAWIRNGTGDAGEYYGYVRNALTAGQVPLGWDAYQVADENRKKRIAAAGASVLGGLSSKEATVFNSLVDKYNKSPLVAANDRTLVLKNIIQEAKADPNNGAKQLSLVYGYVQALDTYQSAVREGELGLVNSIDSKVGKLQNEIQKVQGGQIVRKEVINQIADAAQSLVNTIESGAQQKQKAFEAQAKLNGQNVGGAFSEFIGTVNSLGSTGQTLVQNEGNAMDKLTAWVRASSANRDAYDRLKRIAPDASAAELIIKLNI